MSPLLFISLKKAVKFTAQKHVRTHVSLLKSLAIHREEKKNIEFEEYINK